MQNGILQSYFLFSTFNKCPLSVTVCPLQLSKETLRGNTKRELCTNKTYYTHMICQTQTAEALF